MPFFSVEKKKKTVLSLLKYEKTAPGTLTIFTVRSKFFCFLSMIFHKYSTAEY